MKYTLLCAVLTLVLSVVTASYVRSVETVRGTLRTPYATIYFEGSLDAVAEKIASLYPIIEADLTGRLNLHLGYHPRILILNDRHLFQKMVGSSFFVAIAVPQKRLIVIDYSRMTGHPFTLRTTLKHELCHLLLHDYVAHGTLPRWLDEGIAQWSSDGMAEIIMKRNRFILRRAALTGRYIPLEHLENYFPAEENALLLAYEESKSIVEYIIEHHGMKALMNILEHLRNGDTVTDAVLTSLSIPLSELETDWQDDLRRKTSWLSFVSRYLYEILFFMAAMLSIWGFAKLLKKRRDYEKSDTDDDDLFFA